MSNLTISTDTTNTPSITITPETPTTTTTTPSTKSTVPKNPTWIFYDANKPLPKIGSRTYGLAEIPTKDEDDKPFLYAERGSGLEEMLFLERVVLVRPVAEGPSSKSSSSTSTSTSSGSGRGGLTKGDLVNICGINPDEDRKPRVGDIATGLWASESSGDVLLRVKGVVTAVLEDVACFMVSRGGGAIHPGRC